MSILNMALTFGASMIEIWSCSDGGGDSISTQLADIFVFKNSC